MVFLFFLGIPQKLGLDFFLLLLFLFWRPSITLIFYSTLRFFVDLFSMWSSNSISIIGLLIICVISAVVESLPAVGTFDNILIVIVTLFSLYFVK